MTSRFTDLGRHSAAVRALPGDFAGIARVLHGLFIHVFLGAMYGVELSDADEPTLHLRRAADLLDVVAGRDDRPLAVAREPAGRVVTNCRGFSVLAVAMLRAHGVPARARCGFATYFTDGWFEDHWVVEYRDGDRWRLGDAQIDDAQRSAFGTTFDLTDLPPGMFLTAGEAWRLIRAGEADPKRFGLSSIPASGDWWIAGNLVRDVAAVDGAEALPWDCWAPMPQPDAAVDIELFDRMADGQVPVAEPDEIYNAVRKRMEPFT